jgi:predicted SnoaL-like aldol condensation-catalyzing enzyme
MKAAVAFVLLMCAPAWAVIAPSPASSVPTQASQQELNKAVARRVFDEILNQGKFQVADEIYAPDFVNHGLHRDANLQVDQGWARWEKTACPDLNVTADLMAADGDLVTVVWRAHGTNTVAASPLPATGIKVEIRGITVWRIVDGRIHDEWSSFDQLRIIREGIDQLKWQLLGLLCVAVILLWLVSRGLRMLWSRFVSAKG